MPGLWPHSRRSGAKAADLRFSALTFDTWKQQHVQPRALDDARHSASACKDDMDVGSQDGSFTLQLPCTLHLVPCPRRGVDVQLRLVSLHVGSCSAAAAGRRGGGSVADDNPACELVLHLPKAMAWSPAAERLR